MTSQDTGRGWVCRVGELLIRPAGADCRGHCGGCRHRLDAMHEDGALLDEGWVHFG